MILTDTPTCLRYQRDLMKVCRKVSVVDSDLHKVLELFDLLVYCALLLYILMEDLTEYLV